MGRGRARPAPRANQTKKTYGARGAAKTLAGNPIIVLLKMRRTKTTCPSSSFVSLCGEHSREHAWAAEAEERTRSTPAGQAPPALSSTPD